MHNPVNRAKLAAPVLDNQPSTDRMKKSESGMVPISKLRGVSPAVRVALKVAHLNTSSQLLAAAGRLEGREFLAASCRLDLPSLTRVVQRADLARVVGVGAMFGLLLESLGIDDVAALAGQTPESLLARLRELHASNRLTRRSPSAQEVQAWIEQARKLPKLVSYGRRTREAVR